MSFVNLNRMTIGELQDSPGAFDANDGLETNLHTSFFLGDSKKFERRPSFAS